MPLSPWTAGPTSWPPLPLLSHLASLTAFICIGCGGSSARDVGPGDSTRVSASLSTLQVSPDSIGPRGVATVTVTPRDAAGKKLGPSQAVVLASSGGTATGTLSAVGFTATDSTYRATFTAAASGTALSFAATVNGTALATTIRLAVGDPLPPPPVGTDVAFTITATVTHPISRFIYGGNFIDDPTNYTGGEPPVEMTFNRMGGNRLSAYNWENNFSNAGADFNWQNDRYLSSSTSPGNAVKLHAAPSFARNQAFLATVPMLGYVAADDCECNVGTADAARATRLATHFKVSKSTKGSAFVQNPSTSDATVYQDEFVSWLETTYPGRSSHPTAPLMYSLDNEPDTWYVTHREILSDSLDNPALQRKQSYSAYIDTTISYARAIKAVAPNALIFGPAVATYTGVANLGRYPTPDPVYGTQQFYDVYLDKLRAAEATYGKRLVDVLDTHYYPAIGTSGGEITNDYAPQDSANIWARVNGPRSLWDPTFNEHSWVNNYLGEPIRLLPRLRAQIAAHYPGTKIAISEYYFGRGGDISGGVAQADVLGVFGREGVFAAAFWPIAGVYSPPYLGDGQKAYAYVFAAFRMFRNFDGRGARFGDTGLQATTTDNEMSSVYASRDDAGNIVLVVINKTQTPKIAHISVVGASAFTTARIYALTSASSSLSRRPDQPIAGDATLDYTMPALSVTTVVLQH
jgi:Glycoside hydrolase family 44